MTTVKALEQTRMIESQILQRQSSKSTCSKHQGNSAFSSRVIDVILADQNMCCLAPMVMMDINAAGSMLTRPAQQSASIAVYVELEVQHEVKNLATGVII